jgi:hypothetical protein
LEDQITICQQGADRRQTDRTGACFPSPLGRAAQRCAQRVRKRESPTAAPPGAGASVSHATGRDDAVTSSHSARRTRDVLPRHGRRGSSERH